MKTLLERLEGIQSKERKLVVKDSIAHLIDAQQAIVLMAKEYQENYLKTRLTRVKSVEKPTVTATDYKIGDWILCGWQGLALGGILDNIQEGAAVLARTFQCR